MLVKLFIHFITASNNPICRSLRLANFIFYKCENKF